MGKGRATIELSTPGILSPADAARRQDFMLLGVARRVMATYMFVWEILVGFGFVFLIAVMVLLVNPPEALVKRAFLGKNRKK